MPDYRGLPLKVGDIIKVNNAPFPERLFQYRVTSIENYRIGLEMVDPPYKENGATPKE